MLRIMKSHRIRCSLPFLLVCFTPLSVSTAASDSQPIQQQQNETPPSGLEGILANVPPEWIISFSLPSLPHPQESILNIPLVLEIINDFKTLHDGSVVANQGTFAISKQRDILHRILQSSRQLRTTRHDFLTEENEWILKRITQRIEQRVAMLIITLDALSTPSSNSELTENLSERHSQLGKSVKALDQLLARWSTGDDWRRFLKFTSLKKLTLPVEDLAEHSTGVQEALERFDETKLDAPYRVAFKKPEFKQVTRALRKYATLLQYNGVKPGSLQRSLLSFWQAWDAHQLLHSSDSARNLKYAEQQLATQGIYGQAVSKQLHQAYRSENISILASRKLIEIFLPDTQIVRGPIRTTKGKTTVTGEQITHATPGVRFHSTEPGSFSIDLKGNVETRILASQKQADVEATIQGSFWASRRVTITEAGLQAAEATIDINAKSTLRKTKFRGVLLKRAARRRAQRELQESVPETENRISLEVLERFNPEVDNFVDSANSLLNRFRDQRTDSSTSIQVSTQSTEQLLAFNITVADDTQLASTSPPLPISPDALATLQIHQSVLTNIFAGFGGKTYNRQGLQAILAKTITLFSNSDEAPAPPIVDPHSMEITFSDTMPIQANFKSGKATLHIRASAIRGTSVNLGSHSILVHYHPQLNPQTIVLVRDGDIQIQHDTHDSNDLCNKVALEKVQQRLSDVFRQRLEVPRSIPLSSDPKRQDRKLFVSSLMIADGWIGISLGQ